MQPVQKLPADPCQAWFKNTPVGVNPLKNMMTKVSELAGLSMKYTNHSLRATSASRMFVSGVPEKIVAEVTGHKSVKALRQYERTTDQQFQAVGHSISSLESFDHVQPTPPEAKNNEEKPTVEKAAILGEVQKALPSISGHLNNCTFTFNFWIFLFQNSFLEYHTYPHLVYSLILVMYNISCL